MKANLPQAEPKMLARWAEEDLYGQIRSLATGKPVYILHDGPPYANGRIHLGTAFNKILKDFIVKSKTMAGFDAPYVPGWDCHGLPIEHKVDQELGPKKAQMSAAQIRRACRKYAEKWVESAARGLQAAGRAGALGRSVPDDEPALPGGHRAARSSSFWTRATSYKGLKPVQLVHPRPHGAGRGRGRI